MRGVVFFSTSPEWTQLPQPNRPYVTHAWWWLVNGTIGGLSLSVRKKFLGRFYGEGIVSSAVSPSDVPRRLARG